MSGSGVIGRVVSLHVYPVKGLGPVDLAAVDLEAGHGFPGDRAYAFTNGRWDPAALTHEPRPKTEFCTLMVDEALIGLDVRIDDNTVAVIDRHRPGFERDLSDEADVDDLEQTLQQRLGLPADRRPRLIRAAAAQRFTDVSVVSAELMQSISVINLASVRDLERRCGEALDPRRFRANVYVDGLDPWSELDWLEREVAIGTTLGMGMLRTRRCAATSVDPDSGERRPNVPQLLKHYVGHVEMGIYVAVRRGGRVGIGDTVGSTEVSG